MSFLAVLALVDRGLVDLDAPVATYWPDFAANGKASVLVRHLFSHSAGLPGFDEPVTADDLYHWDRVVGLLAAQAPWWEPGTAPGYHAVTQGYLLGELVRRVDGRSLGAFLADEITGPLGADFHVGLDPAHDHRVGRLVPPDPGAAPGSGASAGSIPRRVFANPVLTGYEPTTDGWRRAEIPAAGGFGNARSVARVHTATANGGEVDGVRILSAETVEHIFDEQQAGTDLVLRSPVRYGLGFGLPSPAVPISPNERACFWGGWGGSLVLADVDAGLCVAYVMNAMAPGLTGDVRGGALVLAAYAALGGT
jgi:CubicO group peptidase (beta-lactamase class C family)